jgi:hypothetical protein
MAVLSFNNVTNIPFKQVQEITRRLIKRSSNNINLDKILITRQFRHKQLLLFRKNEWLMKTFHENRHGLGPVHCSISLVMRFSQKRKEKLFGHFWV